MEILVSQSTSETANDVIYVSTFFETISKQLPELEKIGFKYIKSREAFIKRERERIVELCFRNCSKSNVRIEIYLSICFKSITNAFKSHPDYKNRPANDQSPLVVLSPLGEIVNQFFGKPGYLGAYEARFDVLNYSDIESVKKYIIDAIPAIESIIQRFSSIQDVFRQYNEPPFIEQDGFIYQKNIMAIDVALASAYLTHYQVYTFLKQLYYTHFMNKFAATSNSNFTVEDFQKRFEHTINSLEKNINTNL